MNRALMNRYQREALTHHCRLSVETLHPRFRHVTSHGMSVVLTVNSGYE